MRFCLPCLLLLAGCSTSQKPNAVSDADRASAIATLSQTVQRAPGATTTISDDIDWPAGSLPWDEFTLPTFSPDGLHAAVQLGDVPTMPVLAGDDGGLLTNTVIELHSIDPARGRDFAALVAAERGLILGRCADEIGVLVEAPRGMNGRWIGHLDWVTGQVRWIADDAKINAFPALGPQGEIAWSRRDQQTDRFHLVARTNRGVRAIDDGTGDWLFPTFSGPGRLRAWRLENGRLELVELDLSSRDPLLSAHRFVVLESGASRKLVLQMAATNLQPPRHGPQLAFRHPRLNRMVIWQPGEEKELAALAAGSIAAAPVSDGTWLAASENRLMRQHPERDGGVVLRSTLAIPVATTSRRWTHLLLVPDRNKLQLRAVNLDE